MATTTIEPPHLAGDLKTLCLSTIAAGAFPISRSSV